MKMSIIFYDQHNLEIGWGAIDWFNMAQDRDQWRGSCEHCNEPSGSIKCWEILE
jgi:hypothetical protein